MWKLFVFIIVFTNHVFAVCLDDVTASFNLSCRPMGFVASDKWCEKQFGEGFKAYYTDDQCSESMAAEARGEVYEPSDDDLYGEEAAVCLSFEQGQKLGCELYNYRKATNYCNSRYGLETLAFLPKGACSLRAAERIRKEVSSAALLAGDLEKMLDSAERLLDTYDKRRFTDFNGFEGDHFALMKNEFYTSSMQSLLSYMKRIKNQIYENAQLNIISKADDQNLVKFIKSVLRYHHNLTRIYRLYAYVAHVNHFEIQSYDFANLEELEVVIRKDFAGVLLGIVEPKPKLVYVNNGEDVRLKISEEEKASFEYDAIATPVTKTDYAKLISFMGSKKVLTNLWAVQRMSNTTIPNEQIRSCGGGFLSLRPKNQSMTESALYKELWIYDLYYEQYLPALERIRSETAELAILDERSAPAFLEKFIKSSSIVYNQYRNIDSASVAEEAKADARRITPLLINGENDYWEQILYTENLVLFDEAILERDSLINAIAIKAYRDRSKSLISNLVSHFPMAKDSDLQRLRTSLAQQIETQFKDSFLRKIKGVLGGVLSNYGLYAKRHANRDAKVDQTLDAIMQSAQAFAVKERLMDVLPRDLSRPVPATRDFKLLQPSNTQELMFFFQSTIGEDLRFTLENDKQLAQIASDFTINVSNDFNDKFTKKIGENERRLIGSKTERIVGLRAIGQKWAKKLRAEYPRHTDFITLESRQRTLGTGPSATVAQESTGVNMQIPLRRPMILADDCPPPTDISSTIATRDVLRPSAIQNPIPLTQEELRSAFLPKPKDLNPPLISSEHPQMRGKANRSNPDKVSQGVRVEAKAEERDINSHIMRNELRLIDFPEMPSVDEHAEQAPKGKLISNRDEFVFLFLDAFNLAHEDSVGGYFASYRDQLFFAKHLIAQAYNNAPILTSLVEWEEAKVSYGHSRAKRKMTKHRVTLAERITQLAYNGQAATLNKGSALTMINESLDKTISEAHKKVSEFCKADYRNWKDNNQFNKIFDASRFLRGNLTSEGAVGPLASKRLKKFDSEMEEEVRTLKEKFEREVIDKAFIITGFLIVGVVFAPTILGTGGAAIPALLTTAVNIFDVTVASGLLGVAAGTVRYQIYYIEKPYQLKFERSLAQSMVKHNTFTGDGIGAKDLERSEIINWEDHRKSYKALRNSQFAQIGWTSLDLLMVNVAYRQLMQSTGLRALRAVTRNTDLAVKGFARPATEALQIESYKVLKDRYGVATALWQKTKGSLERISHYQPRYQTIPLDVIKTGVLRQGLSKVARKIGIDQSPGRLIAPLENYVNQLKERVREFKQFSKEHGEVLKAVEANSISWREVLDHGKKYSKLSFVPKSFIRAILEGRPLEYLTEFKTEMRALAEMRGRLIADRVERITLAINKLKDVQQEALAELVLRGEQSVFDRFLSKLTDEEILGFQEVFTRSAPESIFSINPNLSEFKRVFKDHKRVSKDMETIAAHASATALRAGYKDGAAIADELADNYQYGSEIEDIENLYDSMNRVLPDDSKILEEIRATMDARLKRN